MHNHTSKDNDEPTRTGSRNNTNVQSVEARSRSGEASFAQATRPISSQTANKLAGGEEISIGQHADIKAAAAVDSGNPEMMFNRSRGEMNIDTAESIMEQLKSHLTSNRGGTRMIIDLKPESLGRIRIDFKYHGDKVSALFKVDHSDIKVLLDGELNKLKNDFRIDSYRVEVNSNSSHSSSTYHQKNPYFNGERQWRHNDTGSSGYDNIFEDNSDNNVKQNPIKKPGNSMVDLFI